MSLKQKAAVAERVGTAQASLISGIPVRTMQAFAGAGIIPGAAKPAGRWTFDVAELRRWSRQVSGRPAHRTSTEEAYDRLFGDGRKKR